MERYREQWSKANFKLTKNRDYHSTAVILRYSHNNREITRFFSAALVRNETGEVINYLSPAQRAVGKMERMIEGFNRKGLNGISRKERIIFYQPGISISQSQVLSTLVGETIIPSKVRGKDLLCLALSREEDLRTGLLQTEKRKRLWRMRTLAFAEFEEKEDLLAEVR